MESLGSRIRNVCIVLKENNRFGRCLLLRLVFVDLSVLPLSPRESNTFFFLMQITPPAHHQSHRCLSPVKNSDITYVFYLWILQSTSCHHFFTFKCIIQSLQDKIISLAWPQSPPFSLQWTFLWIKQVFTSYLLTFLSLLPLHPTFLSTPLWEYWTYKASTCQVPSVSGHVTQLALITQCCWWV